MRSSQRKRQTMYMGNLRDMLVLVKELGCSLMNAKVMMKQKKTCKQLNMSPPVRFYIVIIPSMDKRLQIQELSLEAVGLLDDHTLARVFHFLTSDMKSLTIASLTCRHWRATVRFYKSISRQVDLSTVGLNCTDSLIWNILNAYDKGKLNSAVLVGCTNITSGMLEEFFRLFPWLSSIDIRGCGQLGELAIKFPNTHWVQSQSSCGTWFFNDSHSKIRSLKQITEKALSVPKAKGLGANVDDFGNLKDYFESVHKGDSANQLCCQSLYQCSKVFNARKSLSILSGDTRMRRWAIKKSENGYKRMEEFLALSLKEIMGKNTFDFFLPKVEIEQRMKNGYYISHGLNSVKDDMSGMCGML